MQPGCSPSPSIASVVLGRAMSSMAVMYGSLRGMAADFANLKVPGSSPGPGIIFGFF